jgi:hypothetical protein
MVRIGAIVGQGETGDHREHFLTGLASIPAIYEINRAILLQAAAYPFGPTSLVVTSAANGTDPRLVGAGFNGTAISMGSTKLLLGISYQATTFSKMDDVDLRHSGMVLYIPHGSQTGDESDRDLLQQLVSVRLNRKVAAISVSRAWGDRFDAGVIVPVVQMASDVRVLTHVIRTGSAQTPAVHEFNVIDGASRVNARFCAEGIDDPLDRLECRGRSTARGLGDLVVWGKATLLEGTGAVAVTVDARLPTGSADELLGLGATQVRPGVVWSLDRGRMGARARAEYTWSNGTLTSLLAQDLADVDLEVPDELAVGFGVDADVFPRTTLAFDVLARRIAGLREFSQGAISIPDRIPGNPPAPFTATDSLAMSEERDVLQSTAMAGVRFDAGGGVMLGVTAVIPVSGGGLRPKPLAVFSLVKKY